MSGMSCPYPLRPGCPRRTESGTAAERTLPTRWSDPRLAGAPDSSTPRFAALRSGPATEDPEDGVRAGDSAGALVWTAQEPYRAVRPMGAEQRGARRSQGGIWGMAGQSARTGEAAWPVTLRYGEGENRSSRGFSISRASRIFTPWAIRSWRIPGTSSGPESSRR